MFQVVFIPSKPVTPVLSTTSLHFSDVDTLNWFGI